MALTIGILLTEARTRKGYHRRLAADKIGINYGTMSRIENAENLARPTLATTARIEEFYGFRFGAILELWDRMESLDFGTTTLEDLYPKPPEGLVKASELTDEELIHELSFRFLMRDKFERE